MSDINKVVFVTDMKNPYKDASSTQIMTYNVIYGLRAICDDLTFVPIVHKNENTKAIADYYRGMFDKVIFIEALSNIKKGRVLPLISVIWSFIKRKKWLRSFSSIIDEKTVLISHSPSTDSIIICSALKRRFQCAKYIQYWSDPLTLSLQTVNDYTYKRAPWRVIEKAAYKYADRIAFGTESLYSLQTLFFPDIKNKSYSVDVAYSPNALDYVIERNDTLIFGYFGNYYSTIRSIMPLYRSFLGREGAELVICGDGDLDLENKDNITIMKRVSQVEVKQLEAQVDVVVCVLNKVGAQIPGKVFYQTNTNKRILVVLDGPRKDDIKLELNKSKRFIFCENNTEDIERMVDYLMDGGYSTILNQEYYNPTRIARQIIGEQDKNRFERLKPV